MKKIEIESVTLAIKFQYFLKIENKTVSSYTISFLCKAADEMFCLENKKENSQSLITIKLV